MREKNSRETILKCAMELFSGKGYEAVSPNEIAEKAGITKPTLYYFFGSKEGLFEELLRINYGELDSMLVEACKHDLSSKSCHSDINGLLLRIVNTFFGFAKANTAFYLMILAISFSPPLSKTAIVSEKYHKNHYVLLEGVFCGISLVHTGQQGRELVNAAHFIAMINARIGFWSRGYGSLDDEAAQSIVAGLMYGIFSGFDGVE